MKPSHNHVMFCFTVGIMVVGILGSEFPSVSLKAGEGNGIPMSLDEPPAEQSSITPNVLIEIPEPVIRNLGGSTIDDSFEVNDVIRGSVVRGDGRFDAKQRFEFLPSEDQLAINVVVSGLANSSSIGFQNQVQVRTRGALRFESSAPVILDQDGLRLGTFETKARLTTTIESIWTPFKLNFRIRKAQNEVYGRRELDRQVAEQHAIRDLNATFDQRLRREYGKVTESVNQELSNGLRSDQSPSIKMAASTVAERGTIHLQIGDSDAGAPPATNDELDSIEVRFHQSAFNAFASQHAGESMTFAELAEGLFPTHADAAGLGDERVLITLADREPVSLELNQGQVTLTIRGKQFDHAGQQYGPMDMELCYRWEESEEEVSVGRQDGTLVAEPPVVRPSLGADGQPVRMGVRGVSLRRILNNALDRDMPKQVRLSELAVPDSFQELGRLVVTELSIGEQWATLHMEIADEAAAVNADD